MLQAQSALLGNRLSTGYWQDGFFFFHTCHLAPIAGLRSGGYCRPNTELGCRFEPKIDIVAATVWKAILDTEVSAVRTHQPSPVDKC